MRLRRLPRSAMFALAIVIAATLPLHAGKKPGSRIPVEITFRDCDALMTDRCPADDRLRSDWGQSYIDGEHGVEAFIGTQGSSGNIGLRLHDSPRALLVDFAECASAGRCNPPPSQLYSRVFLRVDATAVRENGILGMTVNETMTVPARIYYWFGADQEPGFIDFNPNLKGKSPCKGASDYVSVTRVSETGWAIVADPGRIGCVTLPNGSWSGNYHFPFHCSVRVK